LQEVSSQKFCICLAFPWS